MRDDLHGRREDETRRQHTSPMLQLSGHRDKDVAPLQVECRETGVARIVVEMNQPNISFRSAISVGYLSEHMMCRDQSHYHPEPVLDPPPLIRAGTLLQTLKDVIVIMTFHQLRHSRITLCISLVLEKAMREPPRTQRNG
jgi:hypothetical protein